MRQRKRKDVCACASVREIDYFGIEETAAAAAAANVRPVAQPTIALLFTLAAAATTATAQGSLKFLNSFFIGKMLAAAVTAAAAAVAAVGGRK